MQEIVLTKKSMEDLTFEEKQRLVGAFAWLIQEDKKQNPAFYQHKKEQQND